MLTLTSFLNNFSTDSENNVEPSLFGALHKNVELPKSEKSRMQIKTSVENWA